MAYDAAEYVWGPQPGPQSVFVSRELENIFEVVYGGARGGGKTDATLGEFAYHQEAYGRHAKGLLLRRSATALIPTIERAKELYFPLGAKWQDQKSRFIFPNGAILSARYLDRDQDADLYQGHDYTRVYVEELTQFVSAKPIQKIKATLRSAAGVPCCFRATCNPGGPGHNWVKAEYIDAGSGKIVASPNGLMKLFIQAKLNDNPILDLNDPLYRERLKLSGSEALVKAWLEGDWNIIEGAFFDKWSSKNVVRPFAIPKLWTRYRSFDWGYAAPFSTGWWAVASDPYPVEDGRVIPRGSIIRYREWYGCSGKPNEGVRLENEAIARGIKERDGQDDIAAAVADPSIFANHGGKTIAETMAPICGRWRPADNTRVGKLGALSGWDQVRARIIGQGDGPLLYVFDTCRDFIRTIPVLQHDPDRPEDLDCWVAGTLISTPTGNVPIERINPGDIVETPIGPRPVLRAYLSGSGETIKVSLSDGRVIKGTPRHKIYINGHGLRRLDELSSNDIPQGVVRWSRSLNIAVELIAATKAAIITSRAAAVSAFTGKSTWTRATPFLPAGMSTTLTTTGTTTTSKTSSVFPQVNMSANTLESVSRVSLDNGSRFGVARNLASQRSGTTQPRCGREPRSANHRALIVALLLRRDTLVSGFARLSAKMTGPRLSRWFATVAAKCSAPRDTPLGKSRPVHIVAVGRCVAKEPVYNLTIADAHLFYANGILSSNTKGEDHVADEVRYACLYRPLTAKNPVPSNNPPDLNFGRARRASDTLNWKVA